MKSPLLPLAFALVGLHLSGCVNEAERTERLSAVAQSNNAHFSDPVVSRRVGDATIVHFQEVDEILHRAKIEGRKVTMPRVIYTVPPKYPMGARLKERQGGVWVGFVVETDGNIHRAEAIEDPEAISDPAFVAAALAAVREWKFEPGKADGQPIPVVITVPVLFELR